MAETLESVDLREASGTAAHHAHRKQQQHGDGECDVFESLYRAHRTISEISMGGHYDWFLRLGGVSDSRAFTPFVPLAGIDEKGTVETCSREPVKANDIVGEEPDAAMQEGGNPMAEPGESGLGSAEQVQPQQLQEAAPRAVKTLLDGDLRVYVEEVSPL